MICSLEQHKWGTWNLWNLFPHNYLHILNILYYNSNLDLCRFYRFYICRNNQGLMKCLGKGSTGSTLAVKLSTTPPSSTLALGTNHASRVPAMDCGWENLKRQVIGCLRPIASKVYLKGGPYSVCADVCLFSPIFQKLFRTEIKECIFNGLFGSRSLQAFQTQAC